MKKEELLEQVNRTLRSCKKCRLSRTRTNVVQGEGEKFVLVDSSAIDTEAFLL